MKINFENEPRLGGDKGQLDTDKMTDHRAMILEKAEELRKLFIESKIPYLIIHKDTNSFMTSSNFVPKNSTEEQMKNAHDVFYCLMQHFEIYYPGFKLSVIKKDN